MIISILILHQTGASAACQLYGHSCLGGHGKRSDSGADLDNTLQARLALNRMSNLLQRMMSRRGVPSLTAQSPEVLDFSEFDKRIPEYTQAS